MSWSQHVGFLDHYYVSVFRLRAYGPGRIVRWLKAIQLELGHVLWLFPCLDGLVLTTALLKVFLDLDPSNVYHSRILHGARHRNLLAKVSMDPIFDQFPEYIPQCLARSCFGNHAFALDDASK